MLRLRTIRVIIFGIGGVGSVCAEALEHSLDGYDFVIDAIDSVADKTDLIIRASRVREAKVYSSMGAALHFDPTQITRVSHARHRNIRLQFGRSGHSGNTQIEILSELMCKADR